MAKLNEGIKILIGGIVFVLAFAVFSSKYDLNTAVLASVLAGALSVVIIEKL